MFQETTGTESLKITTKITTTSTESDPIAINGKDNIKITNGKIDIEVNNTSERNCATRFYEILSGNVYIDVYVICDIKIKGNDNTDSSTRAE